MLSYLLLHMALHSLLKVGLLIIFGLYNRLEEPINVIRVTGDMHAMRKIEQKKLWILRNESVMY
jgi:hypothetical protein